MLVTPGVLRRIKSDPRRDEVGVEAAAGGGAERDVEGVTGDGESVTGMRWR
jgi:hypothetical protein